MIIDGHLKQLLGSLVFIFILTLHDYAFADRDWEYWAIESVNMEINKKLSYVLNIEERSNADMHHPYLFKVENGISFKLNEYLEIAPYYVFQEKKSKSIWDRSDLVYLDGVFKFGFKELFDLKLANRFRYQYDFDKAKSVLRNSLRFSKSFKIKWLEIAPYISEEPFYDCKLDRITEHRSSCGLNFGLTKNIAAEVGYMLNSKKGANKWGYANVLTTNLKIKF